MDRSCPFPILTMHNRVICRDRATSRMREMKQLFGPIYRQQGYRASLIVKDT